MFLILGVYLLDGGWTIIERFIRKENVFEAHRRHLYQQYANEIKVPHLKISITYFIVQLICNGFVIYVLKSKIDNIILPVSVFLVLSFCYFYIKNRTYKNATPIQ